MDLITLPMNQNRLSRRNFLKASGAAMLGRALDPCSTRRPAAATQLLLGRVIAALDTDPNRRLSDILSVNVSAQMERNEPSLLGGQYRIVLLRKRTGGFP